MSTSGISTFQLSVQLWTCFLVCMFIHTRPSGSNDTTEVIRKGSIRTKAAKSSKYPRTQSHSARHSVQQCIHASQVICRRGVVSSHRVRRHCDIARTSRRRSATQRSDHSTMGQTIHGNQCATPASAAPHIQTATLPRQARQDVAPQLNVVLCNAAVVPSSHSCVRVCCCYPWSDRWCSPQRDRHPALSPLSQTSLGNCCVFVFRSPLTNRHKRLQPLNLSFRYPHSPCNAVGGQHSPRKPRRGAVRLSTTPDTLRHVFFVSLASTKCPLQEYQHSSLVFNHECVFFVSLASTVSTSGISTFQFSVQS